MRTLAAAALVLAMGVAIRAAPVLGIAGSRFTVDGTPRFLVFVSYFDGVRRVRAGVQEDLDYLANKVDGIRVFPNWWAYGCPGRSADDTLIDLNGAVRPAVWQALDTLLDAAAARHLLVDLSFSRESVNDNGSPPRALSPDAFERAVTKIVGSADYLKGRHPHVLVDVQNEWPIHSNKPAIERLVRAVRAVDPDRILVASSSGDAYAPAALDVPRMAAAYHDPRRGDWYTAEAVRRSVEGVRRTLGTATQPVYLQEPMPASSLCPGQVRDGDPAHFAAAVLHARDAGAAAWTFHTRSTFDLKNESLVSKLNRPEHAAEKSALESLRP